MSNMKVIRFIKQRFLIFLVFKILTGCVHVHEPPPPGPHGHDGRAYFQITYDHVHPYSYWDNNPFVPSNPAIDYFYFTDPGVYEFEYFINRHEYWYGTYEVWINPGEPGGAYGRPGADGPDNYFTLVCNPTGFYSELNGGFIGKNGGDEEIVIEREDGVSNMRITMKKTTVEKRKAHSPKIIF